MYVAPEFNLSGTMILSSNLGSLVNFNTVTCVLSLMAGSRVEHRFLPSVSCQWRVVSLKSPSVWVRHWSSYFNTKGELVSRQDLVHPLQRFRCEMLQGPSCDRLCQLHLILGSLGPPIHPVWWFAHSIFGILN